MKPVFWFAQGWVVFALQLLLAQAAFGFGRAPDQDPIVNIPPSHRDYLKVLTLNFNSEDVPTDSHGQLREQRFAAMVDWVQKNDPDILLIQEGWNFRDAPSVAIALARALQYDVHYRLGMGAPTLLYDSNIILAKKQYGMTDRREFKLAHSAPAIGDGINWTLVLGRVTKAIGVRLTLADGEPLYVYTTHLVGKNDGERLDQVRDLSDRIDAELRSEGVDPERARILVGGDLNSLVDSGVTSWMRSRGFADSWDTAHPGDQSCTDCANPSLPFFNPITIGAGLFPDQSDETDSQHLDYLYSRGALRTLASTLQFSVPFETVWMSDHYGILSTFGTGPGAPSDLPNPTHDAEAGAPPTVYQITDAVFADEGALPTSLSVQGDRGLVVSNRSDDTVSIDLTGPGNIYTQPSAELDPDKSAGFSFDTEGPYTLHLKSAWGDERFGIIQVRLR